MSALSEYNSPTYTAVNILGVHALAAYGRDRESRQLARQIEEA